MGRVFPIFLNLFNCVSLVSFVLFGQLNVVVPCRLSVCLFPQILLWWVDWGRVSGINGSVRVGLSGVYFFVRVDWSGINPPTRVGFKWSQSTYQSNWSSIHRFTSLFASPTESQPKKLSIHLLTNDGSPLQTKARMLSHHFHTHTHHPFSLSLPFSLSFQTNKQINKQ